MLDKHPRAIDLKRMNSQDRADYFLVKYTQQKVIAPLVKDVKDPTKWHLLLEIQNLLGRDYYVGLSHVPKKQLENLIKDIKKIKESQTI